MDLLITVKTLLIDYFEEALACRTKMENMSLIVDKKDFQQKVYNAFFNLIAESTQSPESIIHILDTYVSELDGFSTNKYIQTLVGFACLEGLAIRRPEVLNGPWETLAWVIVKYLSFSNATIGNDKINEFFSFRKTNIATLKFITEFGSPAFCPNPCLRLELFRFMRIDIFDCNDLDYDRETYRNQVINTLFELCDNYTSLTVNQVPNFSPMDLYYVMKDNYINMGYIVNDDELDMNKSKIIAAVLKLTKNFALLEKEKFQSFYNQAIRQVYWINPAIMKEFLIFSDQFRACLSFCGLLPVLPEHTIYIPDGYYDYDECLLYLVQDVGNDSLILNYVIDTLDTITQVSLCFPEIRDLQWIVVRRKDKLLHRFLKGHINKLPSSQYKQEIYGGIAPAKEYRLRYFQNNSLPDQYKFSDSNNASECYSSEENEVETDISD